jgi:hypothetical protein
VEESTPIPAANTSPDEPAPAGDILCPLCDYNLRGLEQPRCPECGHLFTWEELLNEHRRRLAWLFEDQDAPLRRSFFQTLHESSWPTRFWSKVSPALRPRVGRLVLYWFFVSLPFLIALTIAIALPVVEQVRQIYAQRSTLVTMFTTSSTNPAVVKTVQPFGSARATAVAMIPMPGLEQLWNLIWYNSKFIHHVLPLVGLCVLWPLIATLSFIIFRDTLRAAKIKAAHVFRCAVYSADVALLMGVALVIVLYARRDRGSGILLAWSWTYPVLEPALLCCVVGWLALLTFRLSTAYRNYLGFRHGLLAAIWAQLIFAVLLLVMTAE